MKSYSVTILMKDIKQFFLVMLFIMLFMVASTFESVDGIVKCERSMKAIEHLFPVLLLTFQ